MVESLRSRLAEISSNVIQAIRFLSFPFLPFYLRLFRTRHDLLRRATRYALVWFDLWL